MLEYAHKKHLAFSVIVVDSRPKFEGLFLPLAMPNDPIFFILVLGKQMLKQLTQMGIPCTYILVNALGVLMKKVFFK